MALRIYVDASADIHIARKSIRKLQERGQPAEITLASYLDTARDRHQRYVEPTKRDADLIVSGEKPFERTAELLATLIGALAKGSNVRR